MAQLFPQKELERQAKATVDVSLYVEERKILNKWIDNIKKGIVDDSNETQMQGEFITDIFSKVLGGVNKFDEHHSTLSWNVHREQKTDLDGDKADGLIGYFDMQGKKDVIAVIELKGPKIDLDAHQHRKGDNRTPIEQAFGYVSKYRNVQWVIVSNYKEIRLYRADYQPEWQTFIIENLVDDIEFQKFYFCMSFSALSGENNVVEELTELQQKEQLRIEKKFYDKYRTIRFHVIKNLQDNNGEVSDLLILEKAQKLMDRVLFVCFAEDKGLLPPNTFINMLTRGKGMGDIFETFKLLCNWINNGSKKYSISAYNGGLFKEDPVLDNLIIDNCVFEELKDISDYDFDSAINESILGHIFEQSISDLEEIRADIKGQKIEKNDSKRKKDGIYYTPEYICKYIVENTIGRWMDDTKAQLKVKLFQKYPNNEIKVVVKGSRKRFIYKEWQELPETFQDAIEKEAICKLHLIYWEEYAKSLESLKVIDPACGSGAFLIAAFNYIVKEINGIINVLSDLRNICHEENSNLFDINRFILENNLYGVDINEASVEITKLSIWLKTANKDKPLTTLDKMIKCGNSLLASDFNWKDEFPEVFEKGGFDVVIGNPPYVKEYTNRSAFDGLYENPCYQGKMDLWYMFGSLALDIVKKEKGYISYIAPSNWITNSGASNFRNIVLTKGKILSFLDFGEYRVFKDAGIQTMIYVMQKSDYNDLYNVNYSRVTDLMATENDIVTFLNKGNNSKNISFVSVVDKKKMLNNLITFNDDSCEKILTKISSKADLFLDEKEIAQGIVFPQDVVNNKSAKELGNDFKVGQGIFCLTKKETETLNLSAEEKELIKPFYTSKSLKRYYGDPDNILEIIYTDSKFKQESAMMPYPNIKKHLDKFKAVLTSSNKPYGLHRARNEEFFKGEKILAIRKCLRPCFTYTDFDCYVSQSFNVIKTSRMDIKVLTAILNSNLICYWLKNKGKMQGNGFQIDKEPLTAIPLRKVENNSSFIERVDKILDKNAQLIILRKKITKRFCDNFRNVKFHNDNIFTYSFSEIIQILKKQNFLLNPTDQDKWDDYFTQNKNIYDQYINDIHVLDFEINMLVYEIYGLTKDEINFVEQNI